MKFCALLDSPLPTQHHVKLELFFPRILFLYGSELELGERGCIEMVEMEAKAITHRKSWWPHAVALQISPELPLDSCEGQVQVSQASLGAPATAPPPLL